MARQSKFALKLKDGAEVRDLEELERAFDPDAIMKHFRSGQLEKWLRDRYYDDAADAISAIVKDDPNSAQKICAALGIPYEDHFDKEFAARIREKRKQLQEMTSDVSITKNARNTAFNQEDLADFLDLDEPLIYLCGAKFTVPLRAENKKYVGVLGTPKINISVKSQSELNAKHIVFENCELPWGTYEADGTYEATATIMNRTGMHGPASLFVQKACSFKSKIQLKAKGKTVDAKSILMIMSMGLVKGTEVTLVAVGPDAKQAVDALVALIDSKFGER